MGQTIYLKEFIMAGFYVLVVGVAAVVAVGLVYIPYEEGTFTHNIQIMLVLGCLIGAVAILWSIIPRREHFIPLAHN